ncbi:hypothetical protein EBZ80_03150 [bacterium]|nr:hypothetical protein [bacterium]
MPRHGKEKPGSMGATRPITASRRDPHVAQNPDSFEVWARYLEAAGLNFDPESRRWALLKPDDSRDRAIRLEQMTLIFRRSKVQAEHIRISIDLRKWGRTAQNAARETFGSRTRAEIHALRAEGHPAGIWVVIEFARPASRDTNLGYSSLFEHRNFQSGFVALHLDIEASPSTTTIRTGKIAGLGYLPADLWQKMPRFIRRSLGLPGVSRVDEKGETEPDEFTVKIRTVELLGNREPAINRRLHDSMIDQQDQTEIETASALRVSFTQDGNITWEHLASPRAGDAFMATEKIEENRDQGHPGGPGTLMADARTRELRARLARDLAAARPSLDIASPEQHVDENPPGLRSLILSLRARECLESGRHAEALDVVSRLVRSIHTDWNGIENSPIASTILHEVLGDCWAAQPPGSSEGKDPFKLATAAWERAGAMRANRLRILRKVAFAAREHGQIDEEAAALTGIIQREKRREELATSMVRLAQIRIETGNRGGAVTPDQLLMQASRLGGDNEQLNFACFQQLVANGNFATAWEFGNKLIAGTQILRASRARAEVMNTLGHLAWSEFKDAQAAARLFRLARMEDPSCRQALQGLATLAARTGNKRLEQDTLIDLFQQIRSERQSLNGSSSESTHAMEEIARRILEISSTDADESLLQTSLVVELLDHTFIQGTMIANTRESWLDLLRWLTLRNDSGELVQSIARAFTIVARSAPPGAKQVSIDGIPVNDDASKSAIGIAAAILNPHDVPGGKTIIEATLAMLADQGRDGPHSLPDSDAVTMFAEQLCVDSENHDWLVTFGPGFFRLLPLQVSSAVLVTALRSHSDSSASWLHPALESTVGSFPLTEDFDDSPNGQASFTDLVSLVTEGIRSMIFAREMDAAARVMIKSLRRSPEAANIICDTMESWSNDSLRGDGLKLLARVFSGLVKDSEGEVFPATNLNSRIRELALRELSQEPAGHDVIPAMDRLVDSAIKDGQTLPLAEIETRLVLERMGNNPNHEALRCLMHQAIICDDVTTASGWFKICLDHAILSGNDEGLASRIIICWLARLTDKKQLRIEDELPAKREKIEEIAAELVTILAEIDPQQAESISAQLGTAGFIQPEDPVRAIASAVLAGNSTAAKKLFTRTMESLPASRSEFASRLFTTLDQMEPRPGEKRIQKTEIVEILLEWFAEPDGVASIPVTLALLTAKHLANRAKARQVLEEVQSELRSKGQDDPRLWIPLYLLLMETATPDEVRDHMDRILPQLKGHPEALAEYPFTVESLEAEQSKWTRETQPEALDIGIEIPAPETFQIPELANDLPIALDNWGTEPIAEPAPEPVAEPAPEPVAEPVPEPVSELALEPVVEVAPEPEPVAVVTTDVPVETPPTPVAETIEFDWRTAVRNRKLMPGMTQKLLEAPMRNKIEKHLALQTVAVMRGEASSLDRWDWRVWRKPSEYGYSRQGKDRFPAGLSPRIMKTPGFKLLLRASPFLALSFPERFTLPGLAKSLGMTIKQLQTRRERIEWATGFPGHAGFTFHAKLFADRGLHLFSLAGLGPQIFYDAPSKAIYIDDAYFVRKPPTHLYHRVMFLLYSLRTQFHPLLQLNPEKQIMPELKKLKTVIGGGSLSILAARVKLSDSRMARLMKSPDFEEFKVLFEKAGEITTDDIVDANKAMQQYVWRLLLADSLDLTGIIEAMLDIDLLLPGSVKPGEVLLMSSQVDPLVNFALALKLDAQT